MFAQDFLGTEGGFATCLRNMQAAASQGASIDFSNWGEAASKLIGLERTTLDALIDLYTEFHAAKCEAGQKKSKTAGVKPGRKKFKLPENFDAEVTMWLNGEISSAVAAKHCGMSLSTFYVKVKEIQPKIQSTDSVDRMVSLWQQRKVTTKEAALKLGVTTKAFNKILSSRKAKRGYTPDAFDRYYTLYHNGTLTKEEAAKLCGLSVQHFECCIRKMENEK